MNSKPTMVLCLAISFGSSCLPILCKEPVEYIEEARHLLQRNRINAAREVLSQAKKSSPENAEVWALTAFCTDKPLECAQKSVNLDPNLVIGYIALGLSEYQLNGSGMNELNKAIALKPSVMSFNARGTIYANSGIDDSYGKALADFNKALELSPNSIVSYMNRGNLRLRAYEARTISDLRTKELKAASNDFSRVISIDPKYALAYLSRARVYELLGENSRAIADLTKTISLYSADIYQHPYLPYPENPATCRFSIELVDLPELYAKRARIYQIAGDFDHAIDDCKKAIILSKRNSSNFHADLARYYIAIGRLKEAAEEYSKELKVFGDNERKTDTRKEHIAATESACTTYKNSLYLKRANVHLKLKDYKSVIADATKVIDTYNKPVSILNKAAEAEAHQLRGLAYALSESQAEALRDFTESLELGKGLPERLSYKGLLYSYRARTNFELKKFQDCIADSTKAIEIDPKPLEYYAVRGSAYFAMNDFEKAIQDFTVALSNGSRDSYLLNDRGYSYFRLKQFDNALADFNAAIQADPKHLRPLQNRAETYAAQGEHQKCLDDLNKLILLNDHTADVYLRCAREYFILNNYEQAIQHLVRALFVAPHLLLCIIIPLITLSASYLILARKRHIRNLTEPSDQKQ